MTFPAKSESRRRRAGCLSLTIKGRSVRVVVQPGIIAPRAPRIAPVMAAQTISAAQHGPLAEEISQALRDDPIRFPYEWVG